MDTDGVKSRLAAVEHGHQGALMTALNADDDEIIAGIEKIRDEKPYERAQDAITALDWISSATSKLRKEQQRLAESDILLFGKLEQTLSVLHGLHESIQSRMTTNEQKIPNRHGGPSSDALDVEEPA
jgi:hypothetical protein